MFFPIVMRFTAHLSPLFYTKALKNPLLLQGIRFCLLCSAKSGNVAVFQLNIFNCSEVEDLLSSKK